MEAYLKLQHKTPFPAEGSASFNLKELQNLTNIHQGHAIQAQTNVIILQESSENELPTQTTCKLSSPIMTEANQARKAMPPPEPTHTITRNLSVQANNIIPFHVIQELQTQEVTTLNIEKVIITEPDPIQTPPSFKPYKSNLPMKRQQTMEDQDRPKR